MIKQEQTPSNQQKIEFLLSKLNLRSIDELTLNDHIDVEMLSKTSTLPKPEVIGLLQELQALVNDPEECVSPSRYSVDMKSVVKSWVDHSNFSIAEVKDLEKLSSIEVGSSEILEVMGRANAGKTFFLFHFMLHCLKMGLTVFLLDSYQNHAQFLEFLHRKLSNSPADYKRLTEKLISFEFRSLSEFSLTLHALGSELCRRKEWKDSPVGRGCILFIDCLSRIEMADPDTDEQNSQMDLDVIEKIKRLLVTFSVRVCSVVYTSRVPNAYTLFETTFTKMKKERNRPKYKNNNVKLWDSIASKTICVEFTKSMAGQELKRIHFTKDLNSEVFTFQRKAPAGRQS